MLNHQTQQPEPHHQRLSSLHDVSAPVWVPKCQVQPVEVSVNLPQDPNEMDGVANEAHLQCRLLKSTIRKSRLEIRDRYADHLCLSSHRPGFHRLDRFCQGLCYLRINVMVVYPFMLDGISALRLKTRGRCCSYLNRVTPSQRQIPHCYFQLEVTRQLWQGDDKGKWPNPKET